MSDQSKIHSLPALAGGEPKPATGAPPCALCGRQPHDDRDHSYRPRQPKPTTSDSFDANLASAHRNALFYQPKPATDEMPFDEVRAKKALDAIGNRGESRHGNIEGKPSTGEHECGYSRSMAQPYPRHCTVCGKVEPVTTMSEHHPSCRESDKDLVWHCSQCGLNESAADIEQQLAAERDEVQKLSKELKLTTTQLANERQQFRDQLAAEQEKVENLHGILGKKRTEIKQLKEQLAVERRSHEMWEETAKKLDKQLSAKREAAIAATEAAIQLTEQLAAEQEKVEQAEERTRDYQSYNRQLQDQLDAERERHVEL